jgi:hypothetical protein
MTVSQLMCQPAPSHGELTNAGNVTSTEGNILGVPNLILTPAAQGLILSLQSLTEQVEQSRLEQREQTLVLKALLQGNINKDFAMPLTPVTDGPIVYGPATLRLRAARLTLVENQKKVRATANASKNAEVEENGPIDPVLLGAEGAGGLPGQPAGYEGSAGFRFGQT